MIADAVRSLFDYQMQEDRRLWDEAIMPLPAPAFTLDTGYSWGTLQRECVHVVDVMQASLQRLHGIKAAEPAAISHDPSRLQVRAAWGQVEAGWARTLASLTDRGFSREIDIVYRGAAMTTPVWQTILHCFNHNTLHRAEMRQMILFVGGSASADRGFSAYCLAAEISASADAS